MDEIRRRDLLKMGIGLAGAIAADGLPLNAETSSNPNLAQSPNPMRFSATGNVLSLRAGWCDIPDWKVALELDGEPVESQNAKIEHIQDQPAHVRIHFQKHQVVWDIGAENASSGDRLLLHSKITNNSPHAVSLGKVFLLRRGPIRGFIKPGDSAVYLPMTSGQQLNQVKSLSTKGAISDIAIQAFNQSQRKALQLGFTTFLRAKTQIEHRYGGGQDLQANAWCDFGGWELQPGATTSVEALTIAVGENPLSQLETWADTAARVSHIRPREWDGQPNGWLGYSWVDPFYTERYEDLVLRNVRSIRERLSGFGVDYVWVSIGNLKDGQPGAWLNWNEENFPSGHKYLYDELEQSGMKWGLWCGAFMLSSKLKDKVTELWDALVKQPDGKQPVEYLPAWGYGLQSPNEDYKKPIYALDPSHPKTLQFLKEVFQTYREWGVRYYMIDFLWAGSDTLGHVPHAKHFDKALVSGPEVFQKGLQAIRDACGDDTHLLAATGPTYHTTGAMDAARVGNDFGEGRPVSTGFTTYPATYALKPGTAWNGPFHALTNQAATYHTHRKLYINNSGNVLTIDKPLQLNQAQINATIHAMSGGPSMLGDDITCIDEERLGLIKKTLPRPRDVAVPVDLFTRGEQGYPQVYHRKVVKPWGTYDVLAIYNLEPAQPLKQSVNLKSIGLEEGRGYHVWEFWNSQYIGKIQGKLSVEVPPYSVKVYRLTEDTGQPVVLGTDMHLLMGEVEIGRRRWDSTQQTLSGRAMRPKGEKGSIFLYAPPGLGVVNPKGMFVGKDVDSKDLIIRIPLTFDEGIAEWSVKFHNLAQQAPRKMSF